MKKIENDELDWHLKQRIDVMEKELQPMKNHNHHFHYHTNQYGKWETCCRCDWIKKVKE